MVGNETTLSFLKPKKVAPIEVDVAESGQHKYLITDQE